MTTAQPDIVVKLVTRQANDSYRLWLPQCPEGKAQWGRCRFTFDPLTREYDWFVTRDDIPTVLSGQKEVLACPRTNTLLFTSEPSSVARYGKEFAAQFGYILTSQEEWALPHSNAIRSQSGNYWHYGKSFDQLMAESPPKKTELFSTICSVLQLPYTMHAQRYAFTNRLKEEIPELEVFGRGIRPIKHKYDGIDPYKFHLTIENHSSKHHWTEKLADAFLGYSVPIYCGCTNIFDYFPKDSVVPIDIYDFHGSLATVRKILTTEGEYERRLEAVTEARRRVIEEYNLPAMLSRIIEDSESVLANTGKEVIYSKRRIRRHHPLEIVRYNNFRIGNFIRTLTHRAKLLFKSPKD